MASKKPSIEAIKKYVRREASKYLKQPNITSIGIGYKIKNGKPSKDLSVQFTVGRKVAPESLESIDAVLIPEKLEIEGIDVPTDVIERDFKPGAKSIPVKEASPRKIAIDPVVPGVSIGHWSASAGTAGCVVYDRVTGAPYILSNWHVFCGPMGEPGDAIVQPGSYDDDRLERNLAGRLVRSYLGIAGDCALATIDHRRLSAEILDLGVATQQIGEPELGDKVVKSGRTTDVTFGVVRRIHTVVRLDYEDVGSKEIGCFEIGPDPGMPAANDEISLGGDSGSVWLAAEQNDATDMMLGLHFAGEVGDEPDHALACYASSVFHKLNILPQKPEKIIVEEGPAIGYAATFLGSDLPLPAAATQDVRDDLLEIGNSSVIDYMHFSLAMSRGRKFARWVAWNIDGGSLRKLSRQGIRFKKDTRIPKKAQIGNELYSNNPLDRGHIARRADLIWGAMPEARKANTDSFYFTNITPQHEAFNQSGANGIWGEIENAVFEEVDVEDLKITVMGGPIFSDLDPVYRDVYLPRQFWKIIYFKEQGAEKITGKGYVLTQADLLNRLEVLELPEFAVYELPIYQIADMTGLAFPMQASPEIESERVPTKRSVSNKIRLVKNFREIAR